MNIISNDSFEVAFDFIMRADIEGGYRNDPRDPGGETKYGISRRAYPNLPIAALTRDDVKSIYAADYWRAVPCHVFPPRVSIAVFDCAVNQGVGSARRLLQHAARVRVDGRIGPITRGAVDAAPEQTFITEFLSWRLRQYAQTKNSRRYMRGWSRRVLALQAVLLTERL